MLVELTARTVPTLEGVSTQDFTAFIARIGKVKENPERLLRYLVRHAHWSPFEHTFFSVKIETSRAIGRELLRHRSFTFQELSQRYEKIGEVEPVELRWQSDTNRQSSTAVIDRLPLGYTDEWTSRWYTGEATVLIDSHLKTTFNLYNALLEAGVARECARLILPECARSTLLMTGSIRSWIHFLAVRDHADAQKEARDIAREIHRILMQEIPVILESLTPKN